MANGNVKIEAHPDVLAGFADILGNADPDDYQSAIGTKVPTVDPSLAVSLMRRPAPAQAAPVAITGLNSPLTLTPYQRMGMSINPQPQDSFGPPMGGPMLGRIRPATNSTALTPTAPTKSFFGKVGDVLGKVGHVAGKIGEVAGDAFAPEIVANIPGTALNKEMLEHQQEKRDAAVAENALTKAKTDEAEARANSLGGGDESQQDVIKAYSNALATGDTEEAARLGPLAKKFIEDTEKQRQEGNPELITTEGGKLSTLGADNVLRPIMQPGVKLPPVQQNLGLPGGEPLPLPGFQELPKQAVAPQKATKDEKENKAVAGIVNGRPAWGVQTEKGWVDPETQQPVPNFKPAPNYAEVIPGITAQRQQTDTKPLFGPDGKPHDYSWNPESRRYDIDQGLSTAGTVGGREYQAGVIDQVGGNLIGDIQRNKDKFGDMSAILNSAFLGTPISDPTSSRLAAEVASFAALQPALHGFRGQDALNEFKKMIGGLPKNPDALIEAIRGIQNTAGVIAPTAAGEVGGGQGGGVRMNVVGSDEHFQEWMKNRKK